MAVSRECLNHKDGLLHPKTVITYDRCPNEGLLSTPDACSSAPGRSSPPPNEVHLPQAYKAALESHEAAAEFPEPDPAQGNPIQP